MTTEYEERNQQIVELRNADAKQWTYDALAARFGITRERVRQIYMRDKWSLDRRNRQGRRRHHRELRWHHFLAQCEWPMMPERIINAKAYWWEGHYLVDAQRICPHGTHVEYRCNDCDRDYGWQGKDPSERKVTR